jgi:hypothetical protein
MATRYCRPNKTVTRGKTLVPTNLSPHSRSLFRAPHCSIRATAGPAMGGGWRNHCGPLASVRAHRWVDAPPSSGSSVGPTHTCPHGSESGDSSSTCNDHGRLEHQWSSQFLSAQRQAVARDLPTWRVDSSTTDGCGRGDLHTEVSSATFSSFSISSRLNSSPSTCFGKRRVLPRLDPHPSHGKLMPLIG